MLRKNAHFFTSEWSGVLQCADGDLYIQIICALTDAPDRKVKFEYETAVTARHYVLCTCALPILAFQYGWKSTC